MRALKLAAVTVGTAALVSPAPAAMGARAVLGELALIGGPT